MGLLVPCPGCGRTLEAPVEAAGRTVKCTACGREFALPAASAASPPPGQAPPHEDRPA